MREAFWEVENTKKSQKKNYDTLISPEVERYIQTHQKAYCERRENDKVNFSEFEFVK